MLARIAFRFSYDSFMVLLEDMGTKGRVLLWCSRLALMMSLDASMKSHQLVLSYGISSCSKCSMMPLQRHKSSFMINNASRSSFLFLYSVIFTPFSRRLRSEDLMPETHFFLWSNTDPCTSYLELLEKMVLICSRFLGHWAPNIQHWNVHQNCCNSAFLDLEVWAQVNFLSAPLVALLTANLGKQCVSFSLLY